MAEERDFTFIFDDIPPARNFIQSGESLRLSYMAKAEAQYINKILMDNIAFPLTPIDPTTISTKTWEDLRVLWRREAEIKYPDEGDYLVWLVDPITDVPVTIGDVFEFIGGEVRENPGILPCNEYTLDLSGEVIPDPTTFNINIKYIDCRLQQVEVNDTADNLGAYSICVGQDKVPYTSAGVFNLVTSCDVSYGLPTCEEYVWDLTGLPVNNVVIITFTSCSLIPDKIEGTPADLGVSVSFCAVPGTIVNLVGVVSYVGICSN